ncbi:MAG: hypothetical protein U1F43_33000 [Myxococcota bacterium]
MVGPRPIAALAIALAVGATGCPSSSFEEHVAESLPGAPAPSIGAATEARAVPVPLLAVTPEGTFEDRALRVTVAARSSAAGVETVTLDLLGPDGSASGDRAELRYRLGTALPFEVGRSLWVRTPNRGIGSGLMLWDVHEGDAAPPLLALASVAGGLADDALPGATLGVADELAYSEVRTLSSGCTMALDHYGLRAVTAAGTVIVPPGAIRRLEVDGAAWKLVALDASRASARFGPPSERCPSGAHVSWVLLRV